MTAFYGNFDRDEQEAESLKTIGTALELGINLLDTAWIYQVIYRGLSLIVILVICWIFHVVATFINLPKAAGPNGKHYYNEELVGKAIKLYGREKFVVCTKFGIDPNRNVRIYKDEVYCCN